MAKTKGIIVELGGDASGLNKAISSVSKEARDTQSELKKIERLLKMDPGNVTLLKQKQELLNESISKTEDVITALKASKEKADADMANGTEINEKAYRELERQIESNELQLKKAKEEAEGVNKAIQDIGGNPLKEVSTEADRAGDKLEKLRSRAESVKNALKTGLVGAAKFTASALTAVSSGVAALTAAAVNNYAEYQQLAGGIDTLFGEMSVGAQKVKQYASEAFMTSGLSANEYMETVTSFSASLIQNLEGDTAAAADVANRAIIDMSDNANKMGTDMASIQNAYQGFAKQNYTMLDNLKLGYGGTQEEMKRLIADASKMTDIQEKLGITVDASSMSFSNIINAISVMQDSLGIAGATAAEAAETISGSVAMTKAAWSNLVTGIADDNADFESLINNFVDSVGIAAQNIVPRVEIALEGAGKLVETMIPVIIDMIPNIVGNMLPKILQSGVEIIQTLLKGIMQNREIISSSAVSVLLTLINGFISMLPDLLLTGALMLGEITVGILNAIPDLINQIPAIIESIVSVFSANSGIFLEIGKSIVVGIWNGILALWESLTENFAGLWQSLSVAGSYQVTGQIPMLADGGTVWSGSAIVGEAGPELLTVSGGKAVVQPLSPNTGKIEGLLGDISSQLGGGYDIPFVVQVTIDGDVVGESAVQYIRRQDRAYGK